MVDNITKSISAKFKIPSSSLKVFTQYHLELIDQDVSCYVSIRRKVHSLESKSMEFVLCDMSESINEIGLVGFTAIVRTVPDLLTYRQRYMEYLISGSYRPTIEFQLGSSILSSISRAA